MVGTKKEYNHDANCDNTNNDALRHVFQIDQKDAYFFTTYFFIPYCQFPWHPFPWVVSAAYPHQYLLV